MHGIELALEEKLDELYYDSTDLVEPTLQYELCDSIEPDISLHAISWSLSPKTMRLVGLINNHHVVILIDSRSSHNFLDPALLKKIQVRVINTIKLQVNVADGAKIQSEGKCTSVSVEVQGNTITTKFDVIPFGGCDIVLGVEWLQTLGPILWDFLLMIMHTLMMGNR